jgi:4-hydroxyphenylpyruvate dioxygenase-like putative hemolysin
MGVKALLFFLGGVGISQVEASDFLDNSCNPIAKITVCVERAEHEYNDVLSSKQFFLFEKTGDTLEYKLPHVEKTTDSVVVFIEKYTGKKTEYYWKNLGIPENPVNLKQVYEQILSVYK